MANRISHVFDLHGPSMTLDTGCSGGLVAMHQACQGLRNGESDAAIVAAANLTLNPDHHIGMSNMHLVSGSGRSYPFDLRGDGYGRGEGCVVFVMKRLDDALRDRDPVRAIVRGTAVNQDGYTPASITSPNGRAQTELARSAYLRASLRPEDVAYVEAHGTGTVAGDQQELSAIAEVFAGPDRSLPLYVGSIKGSIGHTENTSGLAGVLKATLVLERQLIPPVAGFANPKPGLPLDRMHIPTSVVPFPKAEGTVPRASVNSFGFGGANAHAILESGMRVPELPSSAPADSPRLFVFSANTQKSLAAMAQTYCEWLEKRLTTPLADLSYTLCHRRSVLPWRFSCVADRHSSLLEGLQQAISTPPVQAAPKHSDIVFVFTGQGAQWLGMGRELLLGATPSPVFRESIRTSRDMLIELGATWDLEAELLNDNTDSSRLNTAELAQPATTAIQIAIIALLRAQGVRPRAVVGHSSGEIAAAYTAGHLSQRTAIGVAFHRGFMAGLSKTRGLPPGAMMSVGLGENEVKPYMKNLTKGLATVACINSPGSVTISGDADAVDELGERLENDGGVFHRRLLVDTAYHSHHMSAVAEEYRRRIGSLDFDDATGRQGGIEFISSVTGTPKKSGFDVEYWATNLASPVRFSDAVQTLARTRGSKAQGRHFCFLEVGPHSALAGPVRQCLSDPDVPKLEYSYQSVLQRKVDAISSALGLVGRLFERGVKPNFDAVSDLAPGYRTATVLYDLPTYAWDHSVKHWHESRPSYDYRMRSEPYHDLLGVRVTDSTTLEPRWRHMIGLNTLPWLAHHVVDGLPIFPGSGYLCMAAEALQQLARENYPKRSLQNLILRDVSFLRGLVIPDSPQRKEAQISFRPQQGGSLSFSFSIAALSDGEWYEHCRGSIEGILADKSMGEEFPSPTGQLPISNGTTLNADEIYEEFAVVGNVYGPTFTGIRSMTVASDASAARAMIEIPNVKALMPAEHQMPHLIHPSTLDIILHTGLPLVGRRVGPGSVMPVHIDELLISAAPTFPRKPGSQLHVSTNLTSSHFRTTYADITVSSDELPVLSLSSMEMRSLGAPPAALEAAGNEQDICYELDWKPDIDLLRSEDLPVPNLTELVGYISFKIPKLSVLGTGADGGNNLAADFHSAVDMYGGTLDSYDLVAADTKLLDKARKTLAGHSIRYRTLVLDSDPLEQGFERSSYDLCLTSTVDAINHASILLKPNGILVLVLSQGPDSLDESWRSVLQRSPTPLDVQLSFHDSARASLVVMARPKKVTQLPASIQILTHSSLSSTPSWVKMLEDDLHSRGVETTVNMLDKNTVLTTSKVATGTDGCIMVVDDLPESILSDASRFSAVTTLLKQPGRLIWLSPDSPLPMHQITGVSRTAHAENSDLLLTTIHASPNVLGKKRIADVLASGTSSSKTHNSIGSQEREYRVRENGTVLVPRVIRSDALNRAVRIDDAEIPEVKQCQFLNNSQPVVLSSSRNNSDSSSALFVYDEEATSHLLADDLVEIESQLVVVSESTRAASIGQYVGTVKTVGAAVKSVAQNDLVVAIGSSVCASRPRISYNQVSRLSEGVAPTVAAASLLDTMAACHALHGLARLTPQKSMLIHGALSDVGRATVAAARTIGAHITATATDPTEARVLEKLYGIPNNDVLVARRSFSRRAPQDVFAGGLHVIIQASEDPVPVEALDHLKPFGCVIALGQSAQQAAAMPKLPRNAAMHAFDIEELLQACPELTGGLVAQAAAALKNLPTLGLDIRVQDISRIDEAFRLVHTGVYGKVVLQANQESMVRVIMSPEAEIRKWKSENVSYVVAGGLGDLGRRLLSLMAHRGAKHLVSLSRRVVDPDDYRKLQNQLQDIQPGCRLYCITCDVTSESSLRAAANLIQIGIGPVRGVIHSAVTLEVCVPSLLTHCCDV